MDNASKALIMAGAILIAVAIVGIGIYIFASANSLTNNAVGQIDTVAVQMFNNNILQYAASGERINGTRAKQLYDAAKANKVLKSGGVESFNPRKTYLVNIHVNSNSLYIDEVWLSSEL